MPGWMTVSEAARELGVTPARVRALIKAGRLKSEKHGALHWVRIKDLDKVRKRKTGRPKKIR